MAEDSNKKIALITGANKGIGYETARQLANQGITVLIGARDEQRGKDAAAKLQSEGVDARFLQLDVNDEKTYEAARRFIEDKFGKLDILVNNAGIALDLNQKPSEVDLQTVQQTFEVNFFGVISVTQSLLPLIRKSDAGRIVNVSSGLGSLTQHSDPHWKKPSGTTRWRRSSSGFPTMKRRSAARSKAPQPSSIWWAFPTRNFTFIPS